MFRLTIAVCAALTAAMLLVSSCSKEQGDRIKVNQNLAARIGDIKITEKQLERRYEALNDAQKKEYGSREGKAKLTDLIIDEQLLVEEATAKNLTRDEEIRDKIEAAEHAILISEYYSREILATIEVPEDEIQSYYDEHQDEFTTRTVLHAQHIFSADSQRCVEWKRRLDRGEDFNKIAKNESEDENTAISNGNLGYFNPDGYVKTIGYSPAFGRAVLALEVGEISGVIPSERGYSIVKLNEKKPAVVQPLSEVRKRIVDKLRGTKAQSAYKLEIARLREKYQPENFMRGKYDQTKKTPREIWERAQLEQDPYQRIQYYRDLVNEYPDDPYAPQALFMIGFVYAEEVQDLVQARRTFDELIRLYPNADVVESARWMIENVDKPHPKFESIENMQDQMRQEQERAGAGKE